MLYNRRLHVTETRFDNMAINDLNQSEGFLTKKISTSTGKATRKRRNLLLLNLFKNRNEFDGINVKPAVSSETPEMKLRHTLQVGRT